MPKAGWIIGIVMAFVLMTIVASICELTAPLSATAVSRIDVLMNPGLTNVTGWLGNLWGMLWFDYPFFSGTWLLAKYIFFMPISVGISVVLAVTIAQLLATAIGSVGRVLFR